MWLVKLEEAMTEDKQARESRLKILMIAPQPFFTPRGTPLSVLGRLRALSQQEHEVHLLTYPMGDDVSLEGLHIHRVSRIPFLRHVCVGPSIPKLLYDCLIFFRALFMLWTKRFDLIHAHEEAAIFSVILSKVCRTPLLYDMHSSLPEQFENFRVFNFGLVKSIFKFLQYRTVKASVLVIAICPWLQKYVKSLDGSKPCVLVENLLDGTYLSNNPDVSVEQLREQLKIEGVPVAVHVGTLERYQGLDLLIESIRLLKDKAKEIVCVIVGGEPGQVAAMEALAAKLGVGDLIRFTGRVDPWKIPSYIEMADILLSSRVFGNNTPSKIYGYMRSGKPIVATDLPTHTQVLTPEVALLVGIDPESFSEGIARLLEDVPLRERLGRNARLLARERYSAQTYFETMERVMDEVKVYVWDLRNSAHGCSRKSGCVDSKENEPSPRAPRT